MGKKKGESVTLYCTHCTWGTELSLAETESSRIVPCASCGKLIYWHCCETCGLCYVGAQTPRCPICTDSELDSRD